MFWGVENKRRSGDSRIGQFFELLLNLQQVRTEECVDKTSKKNYIYLLTFMLQIIRQFYL
ncbi:hypothetical protein Ahy_A09g043650 [Arachis hypogaea]|uniref:Uncharacterized protein n=1 Tax=Arachis hypogaea TaxID=3818 RepID=A0A445BIU4_ARAHY|nr:hypothetical protein Ahy_A09g043650 [Arachis hypogaea]